MGLTPDALWEVQWHPAKGGRVRRVVLTRRGLRRMLAIVAFAALLVLLVLAALPLGLRGFLTSFTVDAARRDNRRLHLQGDDLREKEGRLAAVVLRQVQRGRRVAWVLGADPAVWRPPCPGFPRLGSDGPSAAE